MRSGFEVLGYCTAAGIVYGAYKALQIYLSDCDLQTASAKLPKDAYAGKAFGHVDILVNNGGVSTRVMAHECSFAVDKEVMNVDFLGQVCLSKAVLPSMMKRRSGQFVNISSLAGKTGVPLRTPYCAAKHALIGWFDALRLEQLETGIRVTNVCPGSVRTNVSRNAMMHVVGAKFDAMDENIDTGMDVARVADRILAAAYKGIDE
eukprot:gene705-1163_t